MQSSVVYHMPLATGEKGVTDGMKDLEADKGSARLTQWSWQ